MIERQFRERAVSIPLGDTELIVPKSMKEKAKQLVDKASAHVGDKSVKYRLKVPGGYFMIDAVTVESGALNRGLDYAVLLDGMVETVMRALLKPVAMVSPNMQLQMRRIAKRIKRGLNE
jgi:hypothetical protein